MYVALDIPVGDEILEQIEEMKDVFYTANVRKLR